MSLTGGNPVDTGMTDEDYINASEWYDAQREIDSLRSQNSQLLSGGLPTGALHPGLTQGLQSGLGIGEHLFGGGRGVDGLRSLTDQYMSGYRDQAFNGLDAAQFANIRQRANSGIQGQLTANLMQAKRNAAANNVSGAAAMAQQAQAQAQALKQQGDVGSQLADLDVGLRERGLKNLQSAVDGQQLGILTSTFGIPGLNSSYYMSDQLKNLLNPGGDRNEGAPMQGNLKPIKPVSSDPFDGTPLEPVFDPILNPIKDLFGGL